MSHYSAFVITTFTDPKQLRQAAAEAARQAEHIAFHMMHMGDDAPGPESLAIAGNQFRFIQGETRTNGEIFHRHELGETRTYEYWSQAAGQRLSPDLVPDDILQNAWNTTDELVTLGLRTITGNRPIFPSVLIEPDGTVSEHLMFPDADVFGDTKPGGVAAKFLPEPGQAWFSAQQPLREIAKAQFRADYLRKLTDWPGHIVIELDWNI